MTRVSKKNLTSNVHNKIEDQFMRLFASRHTKRAVGKMFAELLTKTEKTMLIKRLAIIVMLAREHSSYEIQKSLHVSGETVARLRRGLCEGGFSELEKIFSVAVQSKNVDSLVELILYAGMPPFDGKGRRKWVQKMRAHETIRKL